MDRGVWWRLAALMALVYAVQGSFWPLLAVHLKDVGVGGHWRGAIFATMAIGSMAMPMGAGRLVDRSMATQRYLALASALGTGMLVAMACGMVVAPGALFGFFLVYWLIITPTYGLATSLAMRNLARPREEFGGVRLWGTIGWMAVGWLVTGLLSRPGPSTAGTGAYAAFALAAALSGLLAVYCLTLPDTPPLDVDGGGESVLGAAIELVRRPSVAVFLVTAFGVGLTTPYMYQVIPPYLEARGLPRAWISTVMTLGQYPEIAALAAFPWMFRRLRYKGTLALGIAAYVVRYASLALDPPLWVAIAGIPLHGVGIACFNIGGQVYFDGQAPAHRRAGAQALLTVLTSGIGSLLGSLLAGELMSLLGGNYSHAFLVPCLINLGMLAVFWMGFRPHPSNAEAPAVDVAALPPDAGLATEPAGG